MRLTRRGLLIGAAAGGGLLAAWGLWREESDSLLPVAAGEAAFNAWLKIDRAGVVTLAVPALEMGQGISTLLAQVAAEELGADWQKLAIAPASSAPIYADPLLAERWSEARSGFHLKDAPLAITADGTAFAAFEMPIREAAASVRGVLAMAAADRWDVDWQQCAAKDGFISHGSRRLSFGKLADAAAKLSPPGTPPLRSHPAREEPVGDAIAFPRLDLPAKAAGSYTFAADVRLPGMVYAAVAHGPVGDTVLGKVNHAAARKVAGLIEIVESQRWVATVAHNWFAAEQAMEALAPLWKAQGKVADSVRIAAQQDKAVRDGTAHRITDTGDADALLAKPKRVARYDVGPALHVPVETACATARMRNGKLDLWIATQAPDRARQAAAEAAGISPHDVIIYPMAAGGAFDARLDCPVAAEAAAIAVKMQRPVQVIWSRWQEMLASWPRTLAAAVLAAETDAEGRLLALKTRIAAPATAREAIARVVDGKSAQESLADSAGKADPMAVEGAVPPYAIPAFALEHVPVALPLPTARYRGNAHGLTAFFTECFIDELAVAAKREPMSYRVAMLGHDPQLVSCLTEAARMAEWNGGGSGAGESVFGQGIACHRMDIAGRTGRIAVVVTARREDTGVRVDRICAFADIGRIVNHDIARQQIEGGLLFGLAMAVGGAAAYVDGLPTTNRLANLGLPLLNDCPHIDTAFAKSDAAPFDPGELGVVAVAPALANALYSATGLRFRRLPLLSDGL